VGEEGRELRTIIPARLRLGSRRQRHSPCYNCCSRAYVTRLYHHRRRPPRCPLWPPCSTHLRAHATLLRSVPTVQLDADRPSPRRRDPTPSPEHHTTRITRAALCVVCGARYSRAPWRIRRTLRASGARTARLSLSALTSSRFPSFSCRAQMSHVTTSVLASPRFPVPARAAQSTKTEGKYERTTWDYGSASPFIPYSLFRWATLAPAPQHSTMRRTRYHSD
jgi:hypothetical protein